MRNSLLLCCSFLFCLLLLPLVRSALPNAVRTQFVKSTNAIRSNLALGKLANRNGTKLPAGRNVYQLLYSTELEAEAQKWVDTCAYKYPNVANVAGNAIKLAGIKPINATTAITVVNAWLNPLKTQGLQSLVLTARDDKSVRGFVRMAWATSREIGCAMKQCPSISGTLAVCLYSKATVQVGKMIYGRGAACKKNADCTSYAGSTCTVATGLCYSKPPVPPTTTSKAATTTPKATTTTSTPSTSSSTRISTSTLKPTTTSTQQTTTPSTSSTSTTTTPKPTTSSSTSTTSKPTSTPSTSTSTLKPTTTSTRPTSTTTQTTTTTTTPAPPVMDESLQKLVVDLHNKFRSAAALGTLTGKNGATFPKAAGMSVAKWDEEYRSFANDIVSRCSSTTGTGTNKYEWTTPTYLPAEKALNDSIYAWAATLSSVDPSIMVYKRGINVDGLHLIHDEIDYTFLVGCAVYYCSNNRTQVACAYDPPGNVANITLYETGTPCSACNVARSCLSEQGLCSSYTNKTIIPNLTDAQRMISLNAHNNNRSTVANGNAINKNGTTIPPAKDMLKMTWSTTCEAYAKRAAAPCLLVHTTENGTSQNLFLASSYLSPEYALDRAVRLWYDELVKDGQNSLLMDGTNYNHFTEVVWAKAHSIGCAIAYCPPKSSSSTPPTLVACQYCPTGNARNQYIYAAGPTCSACPTNSTCETSSGLCKKTGVPDIHD